MRLYELQASSIDNDLRNTAKDITQGDTGSGPMQNNQGQQQNVPDDFGMGDEDGDEIDVEKTKQVDNYIVSSTKNMDYVTKYNHKENSKIHPFKLAQMPLDELNQVRGLVKNKISINTFSDNFGLYDDPSMKFYQDMISFVEKLTDLKKLAVKQNKERRGEGPKTKVQKQDGPKNDKPRQVKPRKAD